MGDLSEHSQSQLSKLHYSSPFLFTGNPHLFHADFQTRSFGFSELLIPSKQPRISLFGEVRGCCFMLLPYQK
jgi:hypothetical protein